DDDDGNFTAGQRVIDAVFVLADDVFKVDRLHGPVDRAVGVGINADALDLGLPVAEVTIAVYQGVVLTLPRDRQHLFALLTRLAFAADLLRPIITLDQHPRLGDRLARDRVACEDHFR